MLIRLTPSGLYCEQGDFYIDPARKVDSAIITHAHSDHARKGSNHYLCSRSCESLLKSRLGKKISVQSMDYGATTTLNGVSVSLHPAGHILGSSQIRVEHKGEVWVVSGDYKTQVDPTCESFESVGCDTFISECTFGLPVYRWPDPNHEWNRLRIWCQSNREAGLTSVIHAYSLGKAQRVLHALKDTQGPILVHPAILEFLPAYESQGVIFPQVKQATAESIANHQGSAIVISPSSSLIEDWLGSPESWQALDISGWMQIRSSRRKRNLSSGFIISDHADWDGLNQTIKASEAKQIYLTHGDGSLLSKWLCGKGLSAAQLPTQETTS
jgi:putative mRNA 3-end processing factor